MEQELTTRLPIESASPATEEIPQTIASLAVPLIGSLFQTGGAVWLICRTPMHSSLTWPRLIATAAFFLLITMAAHLFAIWSNRRIFREQIETPARLLIFAIWPSVVWLPLLVLLIKENSGLMAFVPPLIAASAAFSLKSWSSATSNSATTPPDAEAISILFHVPKPPSLLRAITPAVVTSIAFQVAVAELALGRPLTAGSLFAACTFFPIWTYPTKLQSYASDRDAGSSIRAAIPRTLTVLLLIAIALIPYLRSGGGFAGALGALLQTNRSTASVSSLGNRASSLAPRDSYSGVILVLPPKPHHEIVLPPPATPAQFSSLRKKPVIIPFDGAYWYFKQPDQRPKADAPVVRGDPTKKNIRSTDMRPLSMEAHQRLDTPIKMDCCRAIRLAIQNADNRPGAIFVEILLKDRASKATGTQSLRDLVIPSSEDRHISLTRPPVDEILSFPFPLHARGQQFDEITVVIKPAKERAHAGAHIAVQYFELIP